MEVSYRHCYENMFHPQFHNAWNMKRKYEFVLKRTTRNKKRQLNFATADLTQFVWIWGCCIQRNLRGRICFVRTRMQLLIARLPSTTSSHDMERKKPLSRQRRRKEKGRGGLLSQDQPSYLTHKMRRSLNSRSTPNDKLNFDFLANSFANFSLSPNR